MTSERHCRPLEGTPPVTADKVVVLVVSAMRSGSTLLKALLAAAPDVSHLPEVNFQRTRSGGVAKLASMSPKKIVVLKKPCWFTEVRRYPRLPGDPGIRKIILARDVYDTVSSLKRMLLGPLAPSCGRWLDRWLVEHYWCPVYRNILQRTEGDPETITIRYEDLVYEPIATTARLFGFIGSQQEAGVDHYSEPEGYRWKWFRDDASPKIKSLKVQPPRQVRLDPHLLQVIRDSPSVASLRRELGYVKRDGGVGG